MRLTQVLQGSRRAARFKFRRNTAIYSSSLSLRERILERERERERKSVPQRLLHEASFALDLSKPEPESSPLITATPFLTAVENYRGSSHNCIKSKMLREERERCCGPGWLPLQGVVDERSRQEARRAAFPRRDGWFRMEGNGCSRLLSSSGSSAPAQLLHRNWRSDLDPAGEPVDQSFVPCADIHRYARSFSLATFLTFASRDIGEWYRCVFLLVFGKSLGVSIEHRSMVGSSQVETRNNRLRSSIKYSPRFINH